MSASLPFARPSTKPCARYEALPFPGTPQHPTPSPIPPQDKEREIEELRHLADSVSASAAVAPSAAETTAAASAVAAASRTPPPGATSLATGVSSAETVQVHTTPFHTPPQRRHTSTTKLLP